MGLRNESKVDMWLEEENLMLLECWKRDGLNDSQIASRINVNPGTLSKWRREYPEINEALKKGKEIIDYQVENALLKTALGYKSKEVKVVMETLPTGKNRTVRKEISTKDVVPNVSAIRMWLINRSPEKWNNSDNAINVADDVDNNLTIKIVKAGTKSAEMDLDESEEVVQADMKRKSKNSQEKNRTLEEEESWDDIIAEMEEYYGE